MRRTIYIGILVLTFCLQSFQVKAEDVTLITNGTGVSKDKAIQNALVSAVEQVYGVYVSGNTVILNDELIRDEVVQIKRGNIKEYRILNETTLPDKQYSATLQVTVSPDNLLKFAQSKGATCELAGKTFAANLNLYKINVLNGAKAMKHLYNMLGRIAPKIYDYKLNLGDPIVYKSDIYVPVAVDCVLNESYATFLDLYNKTYNSIISSINSVPVKGNADDKNMSVISNYKAYIQQLLKIWAFGFLLRDNLDNHVIPQLNASYVKMPKNAFWPPVGVKNYRIDTNYHGEDYIYGLDPHTYILYKEEIVFKARSMKIQKLDYQPLCSLKENESGGNILKPYVRSVEDKFSSYRALGHTGVYGLRDFDSKMIEWGDGDNACWSWNGVFKEFPTVASIGRTVCTIHFFICYDEADISNITDIKVESIEGE